MSKDDKILSIQYLRGLAALGVVLCHYSMLLSNYPLLGSALSFGQMGVLIFFFISGFIVTYSLEMSGYKPRQFFTFLIKRSIRIDPPYWVMVMLYIGLYYFLNYLNPHTEFLFRFDVGQFVSHLFYAIPFTQYHFYSHVFWTLCVEFQFYIVIGLLYFLSKNRVYRTIFLLAFGALNFIHFKVDGFLFNYSSIFGFGISFVALYKHKSWPTAALPIFFLGIIALSIRILAALILLIPCVIILLPVKKNRTLFFLGNISYSLYLSHCFVGDICDILFKSTSIAQYQLLYFGIELSAAIFVAWLFYVFIERPSISLSKKLLYKKYSI